MMSTSEGKTDRISSLPDCLLHVIMSFLTTQEAVQTCSLSKRWKNLWTTLPFLDFDLCEFKTDNASDDDNESEDGKPKRDMFEKFSHFVSMSLLLREASNLHKFCLSCEELPHHLDYQFTSSWIHYALKHNPRQLDIEIGIVDMLPPSVFQCASLVDLSFSACGSIDDIKVINLPMLRRLHLSNIFIDQDSMNLLLSGCPMLEFLHLQQCLIEFSIIRSQSLKHLKIEIDCALALKTYNILELIDAPSLLFFYYSRCPNYIGPNTLMNMPSLTGAHISLDYCGSHQYYNGKSNIFTGILSVESLKLSGSWLKEHLENELLMLPKFPNVKDLTVNDLHLNCHFNLFGFFLEHFPKLEILSLCYARCSILRGGRTLEMWAAS